MSFDRLAPVYLLMEKLAAGSRMQRCRLAHLDRLEPPPRQVLLAGEGHGRFLPIALKRFPEAHFTVIDFSAGMLARARVSLARAGLTHEIITAEGSPGRVRLIHADILEWQPPAGCYDLIVTHFFLDCFTPPQVDAVVAKLAEAAAPSSAWLLADFRTEERGIKGLRARGIVALLYRFFALATGLKARCLVLPDVALRRNGYTLHDEKIAEWGLLKSQWWRRS